jgi:hypothetical protein
MAIKAAAVSKKESPEKTKFSKPNLLSSEKFWEDCYALECGVN